MKLILIRGPICSGKSTVANLLLKNLPNSVLIDEDAFKRALDPHNPSKWRSSLAFKKVLLFAEELMNEKKVIIADIHLSKRDRYEKYGKLAAKYNYQLFSFLLYPPLEELLKRNRKRIIPDIHYKIDEETIKKYWEDLFVIPEEKCFDSSKINPKDIVDEIIDDL